MRVCGLCVRMRVRRRWSVTDDPSCPPLAVARRVNDELAGMRARLLRSADIARRRSLLDLGAGHGVVVDELRRRSAGEVVAVDRRGPPVDFVGRWTIAEATALPFDAGTFDLVFAQHLFLWVSDLANVLREVARVLDGTGVLAAIEPDFTGVLEQPPEIAIAPVWRAALQRAGARIDAGSALAVALGRAGWTVEIQLASAPIAPDPQRHTRLLGLPLLPEERQTLARAGAALAELPPAARLVHVPYLAIVASR